MRSTVLLGVAVALTACANENPYRVNKTWADKARFVISADTPTEEDPQTLDEALEVDGDQPVRVVTITLGAGVYVLEEAVRLEGTVVRIEGEGPHKTRLELDTESDVSLDIRKSPEVVISGVTVACLTGGGIRLQDCPDVTVRDVHFASAMRALGSVESEVTVRSCVFAGCQDGLWLDGGTIDVRGTAFDDCWRGIGGRGTVVCRANAFLECHGAVSARLDWRSVIEGCLFAGEEMQVEWEGRPEQVACNLIHEAYLDPRMVQVGDTKLVHFDPEEGNLPIRRPEEFPFDLPRGIPPMFDLPQVHLAAERAEARGRSNPPRLLREFAMDQAVHLAEKARDAVRDGELAVARHLAQWVTGYLEPGELESAPPIVRDIASLAR